jgi:hypothetical protein
MTDLDLLIIVGVILLVANKLDIGMVRLVAGIVGLLMLINWADPVMFRVWLYG